MASEYLLTDSIDNEALEDGTYLEYIDALRRAAELADLIDGDVVVWEVRARVQSASSYGDVSMFYHEAQEFRDEELEKIARGQGDVK